MSTRLTLLIITALSLLALNCSNDKKDNIYNRIDFNSIKPGTLAKGEEIYNNVRVVLGTFLLFGMFMIPSCEDDRLPEPEENIQMFVNGSEIVAREYYESVTTFGASEVQEDGSIKKIFVLHFQKEFGRVAPEKSKPITTPVEALNCVSPNPELAPVRLTPAALNWKPPIGKLES